jgi:hypothetical protein
MTVEELREIFKPQIDTGCTLLFYIILARYKEEPRSCMQVRKCAESDLESLTQDLYDYKYTGIFGGLPRFI